MRISDWSSDVCSSDLSVVRSLLASIVTLRSPRDLQLVVVCADDAEDAWSWTQWLPHVDPKVGPVALIGNTDDTRRDRVRELALLVQNRARVNTPPPNQGVALVDGRSVERHVGNGWVRKGKTR